jgi:nucleoid DNA-binding protein
LNAKEFNKALAAKAGFTQQETSDRITALTGVFHDFLGDEKSVTIQNFGTFSVKKARIKKGFSPILKKYVIFPPKMILEFHASNSLKDTIQNIPERP